LSDAPERLTDEQLVAAIGAVVFASDEPVIPREVAAVLGDLDVADVERAIRVLEERYAAADLGVTVERIAGGVRLATRSDVAVWVRRHFRQRNRARLSPAALETLAIIAYRQPVTAPEIQAIRGKDPTAALHGLLEKRLVRCLGRKKVVGNPLLYGTSREFLVHFGLDSLGDLPSIDEFDRFLATLDAAASGAAEPAGNGAAGLATDDEAEGHATAGPGAEA
jgi:segregation and condensation protein B